jgi:hypothetical protein
MITLSAVYSRQGKHQAAVEVLVPTVASFRQQFGLAHPDTQKALGNLVSCYAELNDHENVARLCRELTDFWRQHNQTISPLNLDQLGSIGRMLLDRNQLRTAQEVLRASIVMCDKQNPAGWERLLARLQLSIALADFNANAEVESLLNVAEVALKAHSAEFTMEGRTRLVECCLKLVQYLEVANKTAAAKKWQQIADSLKSHL